MTRRVALCVGINDYPGSNADLSGCINDANDMASMLSLRGYEVHHLHNSEAIKNNITSKLRELISALKWGDRFVFTFSGHGTWIPDLDGDEVDHRDEALCCHDYATRGVLSDDEMHTIFSDRRAGVRVTVLSDSCHSGTVARFADFSGGLAVGNLGVSGRAKFLPPSLMFDITDSTAEKIEARTTNAPSRPGTVLISGCDDHEYSYDANFAGRPNGAMTYCLLRSLKGCGAGATTKRVYESLRQQLPTAQYPQTPQLAASYYQKRTALI
jgi:hypothetical protein